MSELGWRSSPAQLRAVVLGTAGVLAAVVWHRPDVLVLGTPLLVVAVWGAVTRPTGSPDVQVWMGTDVLHEGDGSVLRVEGTGVVGSRQVTVALSPGPYVSTTAPGGVTTAETDPHAADVTVDSSLRFTRWGVHPVGSVVVVGSSDWAAYRWGPLSTR